MLQVLAAALLLEAHTGKSQAVTGIFDILKSLTWQLRNYLQAFPDMAAALLDLWAPSTKESVPDAWHWTILHFFIFLVAFFCCVVFLCIQLAF